MRALMWEGVGEVKVDTVPDPVLRDPDDIIVKVSSTAICGSDLHLLNGYVPTMEKGDIMGHEFMGEVVDAGPEVTRVRKGDRVLMPFAIGCGECDYCRREQWSLCDRTNPNYELAANAYGYSGAGIYGYSHIYGGFSGGQAEYVRVPRANANAFAVPAGLRDEQVLFLTDIFPTGYMAAEVCGIRAGDTVAVWGCGPVGQFAIRSCFMLGAEHVVAIDRFAERLAMARSAGNVTAIDYTETDNIVEAVKQANRNHGADHCIDAVGMEAHGTGLAAVYDKVKQAVRLETDRPTVLRQAIQACRKGGTVSIPGVYGGLIDKMNMGAAFAKGLTFRMGQTHVHRYVPLLMKKVQDGEIDPAFVITHRLSLEEAAHGYHIFRDKEEGCVKVVLRP